MTFLDEERETHEDHTDEPVRCGACKDYFDPDLITSSRRGGLCHNCVANGEADR